MNPEGTLAIYHGVILLIVVVLIEFAGFPAFTWPFQLLLAIYRECKEEAEFRDLI